MRIRILLSMAAAAAMVLGPASRAAAADISWSAPAVETGNASDILTDGTVFAAVTAGHNTTANGVSFVGKTSMTTQRIAFGDSPVTVDAVQNEYGQYGTPPSTWNAGYQSLVAGGAYSEYPTRPMAIHLNGLIVGNKYTVQIFEAFWNTNFATAFVGGKKTSGALNLSGGGTGASSASATPQYVVGTFVADADGQSISLVSKTGYVIFDAIQVRDLGGTAVATAEPNTNQIISALRPNAAAKPGGAAVDAPSLDLSIEFKSGSAILTPAASQVLDKLGSALTSSDLSSDRFRIEGHTDTVGAAAANKILSQQRAEAAASYLEKKFGIAAERLQTIGVGEDDLLVPTPDQTPELRNRRVHIVNLGAYANAPK